MVNRYEIIVAGVYLEYQVAASCDMGLIVNG